MQKLFYILFAIAFVFVLFTIWYFFLNIYEVKIETQKSNLDPDEYRIKISPINSVGQKIDFRNVNYKVNILEGKEFIRNIKEERNIILIRLVENGRVKLSINTEYSLFESIIEIPTKSEER